MKNKHLTKYIFISISLINFIFWFIFLSSIYTSDSVLRIEEIKENEFNFGNHLAQNYEPSLSGSYLFAEWLRSEKAYELLCKNLNMRSFYKKGDIFTKKGGIYNLFMHGDRSEWQYFNQHLSIDINNNSQTVNLAFSSFNQYDSQQILYKIVEIGKKYLKKSYHDEDLEKINYINNIALYVNKDLQNINKILEKNIRDGSSIYPKETYLNQLLINNILEKKLVDVNTNLSSVITTNSPVYKIWGSQKRFIQNEQTKIVANNILQTQQSNQMESILRKRSFLELLSEQIEQQKYILQRSNYIDKYKVNVISPPSLLAERSGPYRLKGFIISFLIISLIYWLIKE